MGFELTTLGTDCTGSYKSNYHMIMTTTRAGFRWREALGYSTSEAPPKATTLATRGRWKSIVNNISETDNIPTKRGTSRCDL